MISIPADPKNAAALRQFYTDVRTQMCDMGGLLGEPWLSHFNQLKAEYDAVLAKLGASDQVPAAFDASNQLSCLYSMLVSANSLTSMLSAQMNSMKQSAAAQTCSEVEAAIAEKITKGELVKPEVIAVKITEAITAKTTAGELVPREQHTQLCSAAKDLGITEGKAAVAAEQAAAAAAKAVLETRKTALQTAGLPIPDKDLEKLLGGTDEEFATRQTLVKTRVDGLKAKSAYHSKLAPFMWLDDAGFKAFEVLAGEVSKATGHEPFQQPTTPGSAPAANSFAV